MAVSCFGARFRFYLSPVNIGVASKIVIDLSRSSAIGLATYVVNAGDQAVSTPGDTGNYLFKYADNTYFIIPECNAESRTYVELKIVKKVNTDVRGREQTT